jgi:3-deoxy-D-manno-octulosonic-acid transferase
MFYELETNVAKLNHSKKNILIQCSSLGEFEEAKPIIEELDKTDSFNFIISFFSPSGFENARLDFPIKSNIIKTYLPFDRIDQIRKFIKLTEPASVLFIKYDLWFNFLYYLSSRMVLKILVNASYNRSSVKFKVFVFRSFYKALLKYFDIIVTKDEDDAVDFRKLVNNSVKVETYGDTKIERIRKAIVNSRKKEFLNPNILKNKKIFVVGSSWNEDECMLLPVIDKITSNGHVESENLLTIIAPHEPDEENVKNIEKKIQNEFPHLKSIRYSKLKGYKGENVIIVDCIGILLSLYRYADIAYVGGGLQSGLHNVFEPAGYGIPVLFGNLKLSEDAQTLIESGGGIPISNSGVLYKNLVVLLDKTEVRQKIGEYSAVIFRMKADTSKNIAKLIPA